jgi:predicted transcriptional regulator
VGAEIHALRNRTKLEIVASILDFLCTAKSSPKKSSHIVRDALLSWAQFSKYMKTLQKGGFVKQTPDGLYQITEKGKNWRMRYKSVPHLDLELEDEL